MQEGMMTDAKLLRLYATEHDHDAFRTLVERHAGMVYGVARRQTGDGADRATSLRACCAGKPSGRLPGSLDPIVGRQSR